MHASNLKTSASDISFELHIVLILGFPLVLLYMLFSLFLISVLQFVYSHEYLYQVLVEEKKKIEEFYARSTVKIISSP